MSFNALVPTIFGIIGLVVAYYIYQKIKEYPEGDAKVADIGEEIHLGAMVFMRREYRMLFWFALVLFLILLFSPGLGFNTAI
ncbi:MAG: sodium/proton-translocating pyrophosphatase, partial [Gammaproteobacteria bacterium]|nr:sodium/proton-translocating pyrophosphatase [Gammaproteobacteria bacterium]